MRNETNRGHRIRSLVLNRVLKCITFALNRLVFEDPADHITTQTFPQVPPPPDHLRPTQLSSKVSCGSDCHELSQDRYETQPTTD